MSLTLFSMIRMHTQHLSRMSTGPDESLVDPGRNAALHGPDITVAGQSQQFKCGQQSVECHVLAFGSCRTAGSVPTQVLQARHEQPPSMASACVRRSVECVISRGDQGMIWKTGRVAIWLAQQRVMAARKARRNATSRPWLPSKTATSSRVVQWCSVAVNRPLQTPMDIVTCEERKCHRSGVGGPGSLHAAQYAARPRGLTN